MTNVTNINKPYIHFLNILQQCKKKKIEKSYGNNGSNFYVIRIIMYVIM